LLLSELTASAPRLALVGLAKNTGKTVALAALLSELQSAGKRVGVTSVGRDGEQHDVIDFRIEKPLVRLPAGALVATTDSLLSASGLPHEIAERTGMRTPLGEVLIAVLNGPGAVEIAGPSASAEVRAVSDAMLALGAEQVLIDGAIDRRAASSPEVSDALVMSTGAILSEDLEVLVARTRDAVELVRLASVSGAGTGAAGRVELSSGFVLSAQPADVAALLAEHPEAQTLEVAGALPEAFVKDLAAAARRADRELTLHVGDPTRAFFSDRGPRHYARQGIRIEALRTIDLRALTVNPLAPRSHSFESSALRRALGEAIPDLPVFDVMSPEYRGSQGHRKPTPGRAGGAA
jgi:hypothetical protein